MTARIVLERTYRRVEVRTSRRASAARCTQFARMQKEGFESQLTKLDARFSR